MYNLEKLVLLTVGTHDTGPRQTNAKVQHNTMQKTKKMSNTNPTLNQGTHDTGLIQTKQNTTQHRKQKKR